MKSFFILLCMLTQKMVLGYYSLWEQDIFVEKNNHILINTTEFDSLVSDHILQTSGEIQITLVSAIHISIII